MQTANTLTLSKDNRICPYNYDYDLCGLAVAVALLMPDVAASDRPAAQADLAISIWIATGSGFATMLLVKNAGFEISGWTGFVPAVAPTFYVLSTLMLFAFAAASERKSRPTDQYAGGT
ncbi:hypothetical protein GI582_24410 [Sulfitobacter sp. BDSS02]|nr:hypothetical protein [Sulfitobacter sp. BDSS02]MBR9852432.1 hypothetical protein [Paracoccaceae bacterium]